MYIIRPPPMSTRLAKESAGEVVESEAHAQAALTTSEKAATVTTSTARSWRPLRTEVERTVGDVVGRVAMTHSLGNGAGLRALQAPSCNNAMRAMSALGQERTFRRLQFTSAIPPKADIAEP